MKICQLPSTPKNNSSNVQLNIHKISALMIKAYDSKALSDGRIRLFRAILGESKGCLIVKRICVYIFILFYSILRKAPAFFKEVLQIKDIRE